MLIFFKYQTDPIKDKYTKFKFGFTFRSLSGFQKTNERLMQDRLRIFIVSKTVFIKIDKSTTGSFTKDNPNSQEEIIHYRFDNVINVVKDNIDSRLC